jgi:hypothetical protein
MAMKGVSQVNITIEKIVDTVGNSDQTNVDYAIN